ncbi:MAG: SDR family NAD(P)-dependent oxidoreductase [Acidimicrobiaceae bacterium]|nr:SDR family NAD(P)-dependent oxidoreductase [Acidimicrobiaceae bacterium]MYC42308.1 SDR family NAD(P)-dependent oxidoreductase [Acidimicrobiaceae bacterium]
MADERRIADANGDPGRSGDSIAVVGMACRFPGANDLTAFWNLLEDGKNAITEGVPGSGMGRIGELFQEADVQNDACRFAGFIDGIDQFDASFFRISPVEAQLLDPQQRLMLETSWQALEDAGIDADQLRGSRTGVYAGISNNDYRGLILTDSATAEAAVSLYSVSGTSFNTAIGRVAFALGLQGPALAVDTACSSSLAAVHQAVSGLQRGEADLALAGGVHVILSARLFELRGNAGMLAPDGRCKTFDAGANGYVRGEGCGILVLKRLSDAEADGDRIWGVIRGTALNQDGASTGLTVPNGEAQAQVIAEALARAGTLPSQVDYVEAHGTGTPVGDPIELTAAAAAYCRERDADQPLFIGSVKTNVGHLEPAAGVAGMIKVMLSMKQQTIPKHLNFQEPNPVIDWDRLPLRVTTEPTPWPRHTDRMPMAGVSGFGWSGTNAHIIVEAYGDLDSELAGPNEQRWPTGSARLIPLPSAEETEVVSPDDAPQRPARLLLLSGKSSQAQKELAGSYLRWLEEHSDELASPDKELLADMSWTAAVGRSHFSHRAGVVFEDAESLRQQLSELVDSDDEVSRSSGAEKVAFVYTGQGSQWIGMGKRLYESEPVARAVLDQCDELFREARSHESKGTSLLAVMFGRPDAEGDLDDPAWTQPAIYSLQCALTALWSNLGVNPGVVVGHSLGEIAAAHTAGVLSLADGLRLAIGRGALMSALDEPGAMAGVFAPLDEVETAVARQRAASGDSRLSVAADNGAHLMVSGPVADVDSLLAGFESEGIQVRRLEKSAGYHSAMVDPILDGVEAIVSELTVSAPSTTLVSSMTGGVLGDDQAMDASYWRRQARQAVEYRSSVETLAELGVDAVIEVGPGSVLGPMTVLAWPTGPDSAEPAVLSSMRRPSKRTPDPADGSGFLDAVAGAYQAGLDISFEALFAGESRRRISLPGYPFQRQRHWVDAARRRRSSAGHPLLGVLHESPRGELQFETEMDASEPAWLNDHRVYGQVITPGALYATMAVSALRAKRDGQRSSVAGRPVGNLSVEDLQLHSPMAFPEAEADETAGPEGRRVQLVFDDTDPNAQARFEIYSRGPTEDGWTLHAEGGVSSEGQTSEIADNIDIEDLNASLEPQDISDFYRARAEAGIDLGAPFRTLDGLWASDGEALGDLSLPETAQGADLDVHPLLLDGCFQVMAEARSAVGAGDGVAYLPFGWEKLWLAGPLPEAMTCHARLREDSNPEDPSGTPPEVLTGDLAFYDPRGTLIGGLIGYTVKRATRAAMLSAAGGLEDLLYEIAWRDRPLPPAMLAAEFIPAPSAVAVGSEPFSAYLADEDVGADSRDALLSDLERLAWSYARQAMDRLGWDLVAGEKVVADTLRELLGVLPEHRRVFQRMLEMLAKAGVLIESGEGFVVKAGSTDPLPEVLPSDPEELAERMEEQYPHGATEIGLFRRSGAALPDVLVGEADALTLLFSSGEPSAADLYLKAPVARAANRMLQDAVAALLAERPEGRRLRVIEVGAGTGSATASVLPELGDQSFDYTYTDISAGFFSEAEARFGGAESSIDYRVLDIENDPVEQGFDNHGYDLVIASNVLHATRYLNETLDHCRRLLAPSGCLLALENLRGQGWLDLTFGQLDGWWRFADDYRPHHALAGPDVWQQALSDAGFVESEVLGVDRSDTAREPDRGVIVAQGPAEVSELPGVWIVAADFHGSAEALSRELALQNQTVVLVNDTDPSDPGLSDGAVSSAGALSHDPGVSRVSLPMNQRESWQTLFESVSEDATLRGVVHLVSLDGRGAQVTTEQLAQDVTRTTTSALALVQGISDSDATPANGVWIVTRGAQVLEHEPAEGIASSLLWGFGKVLAREAPHLSARMIDLDPAKPLPLPELSNELLHPDTETHIAYRLGLRQAARLARQGAASGRPSLPDPAGEVNWLLEPDSSGALEGIGVGPHPVAQLAPQEVRVAVEAAGLNFWDMFRALGVIDEGLLGGEFCGRVIEVGSDVSAVAAGDRVVGLAFGTFGSEVVTDSAMVAPAPEGPPAAALATVPTAFVSALLSFDLAELKAGERVLIHAGTGGVGLAAVQLAQAAGAEVFATTSAPKQAYLRSLGVDHVFDSRQTKFGEQILEATDGEGVEVVLNSLTGPGFIDASLSCLADGGRFVELARVDILSKEEMSAVRPDVAYWILELDVLKESDPATPGDALRRLMDRLGAGELSPLVHTRWSLPEAGSAMKYMQAARHIGKIVLANSALETGRLRDDRTYLVTGGLGGIGCAVANWLADRGAGAIVLNGRRDPDPEAAEAISDLRQRGVAVSVELADVTDPAAIDAMLARMDAALPPLGGVVHSVGVLSDGALTNQTWEKFTDVLWPKMLGAWHLHRATEDLDLDMFVLFSSVAGVMGNPGQSNHAAANAFLDQLAGHRRALGLTGQSIAWGAWSGLGEAEEHRERIARQLEAAGTGWITPDQGIRAFDHLVRQDVTMGMVAAVDWHVVSEGPDAPSPLLQDLLSATQSTAGGEFDSSADILADLLGAGATEREQILAGFLQQELRAVMRLPELPSESAEFADLGMDSLMVVELRNRLNRAFAGECTVSNTAVFNYPNVTGLARFLASEFGQPGEAETFEQEAEAIPEIPLRSVDPTEGDGIAIVGMACRFPGAEDLSAYWRLLADGENTVTDGRQDGGSWEGVPGDPAAADAADRRGSFIDGIDHFDPTFFRISPKEAATVDPLQRLLLETSWQAVEDAAIDPDRLKGSRSGVYVGVGVSEYRSLIDKSGLSGVHLNTAGSVTVGRVAFTLGFEGPAVPLDLACASSLVAVHQASESLRRAEIDLALVGGVNAVLSSSITRALEESGMLSVKGQCSSFDASADGYVRGEGCGVVVLKRLRDAEQDGDRIWGVIRGSAVNQSGTGLALTVPSGRAQQRVMAEALARAGASPDEVDYVEAHGAGTAVGDAVEAGAVAAVYGRGRSEDSPLWIGSVKTNIGHLESASAIASLIKVVLGMRQGVVPKQLNFSDPSPEINWDRMPMRVASESMNWPHNPDRAPLAAVNSFGISGANAHIVIEGYEAAPEDSSGSGASWRPVGSPQLVAVEQEQSEDSPQQSGARLLPLSAKTPQALREMADRYLCWLDEHAAELSAPGAASDPLLSDMAWTASTGRSHFSHRAAVVFTDVESLRRQLNSLRETGEVHERPDDPGAEVGEAAEDLVTTVAAEYSQGRAVQFESLFQGETRRRISLPDYPFQRQRYWV